jgi:hypothetical protein
MPPLIALAKEIDLRVKYSADRALKALCDGSSPSTGVGMQQYQNYLSRTDSESQRFLKDYYRRVISQLADDEVVDDDL